MKSILFWLSLFLFTSTAFAQTPGINYKAIIKNASGNVISNDLIQIQFGIIDKDGFTIYTETHSPTTDVNGLVIVNIGEGAALSGVYDDIDWSSGTHYLNVQVNTGAGLVDMGSTEFKAVPFALTSLDKTWTENGTDAYRLSGNIGIGTDTPTSRLSIDDATNATMALKVPNLTNVSSLELNNGPLTGQHAFYKIQNTFDNLRISVDTDLTATTGYDNILDINSGGLKMNLGTTINEFSTDGNLSGNSNTAVPTEAAVKTYVDNATSPVTPIVFKVRGNGFAVKDLDGGTTIETDIWDIRTYDTRNAFNTTTKRYIVPESGYYYLHAVVRQSNTVTTAFFRMHFNVDTGVNYNQIMDGDDVKINISGIYFLNAGQEVFVNLRNFSAGNDVRIDGTGSWFEGYKIN